MPQYLRVALLSKDSRFIVMVQDASGEVWDLPYSNILCLFVMVSEFKGFALISQVGFDFR